MPRVQDYLRVAPPMAKLNQLRTKPECLAAQDYLRVALPMARAANARTLFVSTDSPDMLAELEAAAPAFGAWLHLAYEKDEIRGTDITNANLQNNLRLNVTRYTSEAVRSVLLLADTALLLCTFSSNFGRLAYELLVARPHQEGAQTGLAYGHLKQAPLPPQHAGPNPPAPALTDAEAALARQLQGVAAVSLDLPWFAYP